MVAELSPRVTLLQTNYPLARAASWWGKIRLVYTMLAAVPKCDLLIATHTPTTVVSLLAGRFLRRGTPVWFFQDYPEMFAQRPVEAWLLRHALAWHRGAIAVSQHIIDELLDLSASSGDVRYIGDAISHYEIYQALQNAPKEGYSHKKIMYLGDFRPRKGLADFLQAAEIVYETGLQIELCLALKEDGAINTFVPYRKIIRPSVEELVRCYASSDLFVSASWKEGFGLPALEAMACGTPVVLTDSGGVREYARPGENCLMTPPKDAQKLATAILEVLSNPALAQKFAQHGPLTAQEYTWEKAVDRMESALLDFFIPPAVQ